MVGSVSYTHLDVYKRQAPPSGGNPYYLGKHNSTGYYFYYEPVSYTHLDVYKRQEPVRSFFSGKLLQLMLQCLCIIDGFPQFLFAFFQLPVELFQF